jgi:hypothetical protein
VSLQIPGGSYAHGMVIRLSPIFKIGACFKVQTGDIEEAPAWDALPCFETSIAGDDVSVQVEDLGMAHNNQVN